MIDLESRFSFFIIEWQGLGVLEKIMKKEKLKFHIDCVKDTCYSSFQFNLFKTATYFTCLLLLVIYDRLIIFLKPILMNLLLHFWISTWSASL